MSVIYSDNTHEHEKGMSYAHNFPYTKNDKIIPQSLMNTEIYQKQMGNQILLKNRRFWSHQQNLQITIWALSK